MSTNTSNNAATTIDHATRRSTETKLSTKTTEFFFMIAVIVGIVLVLVALLGFGGILSALRSAAWLILVIAIVVIVVIAANRRRARKRQEGRQEAERIRQQAVRQQELMEKKLAEARGLMGPAGAGQLTRRRARVEVQVLDNDTPGVYVREIDADGNLDDHTIVVDVESAPLEQIVKQLFKLIEVIKISELDPRFEE